MSTYTQLQPARLEWRDGLPFSPTFEDIYFSRAGGADETRYVFLRHNGLPDRWLGRDRFVIAETGFGTGLNFLVTVASWLETAPPGAVLYYLTAEKHPLTASDLRQVLAGWPEFKAIADELMSNYPELVAGYHRLDLCGGRVVLQLMFGDACEQFTQLQARVDAWYLDGFAPGRNVEMWSPALFAQIARLSVPGCTYATYTAAGAVRRGLSEVGFSVGKAPGFGGKREMIHGEWPGGPEPTVREPWYAPPPAPGGEKSAVVVGAGLAGASTAYALASRGWQVTLIEQHAAPAQEASGNLAGVVLPRLTADMDTEGRFYLAAFLRTVCLLDQWALRAPGIRWQQRGVLQLETEAEAFRYAALGLPEGVVQAVGAKRARALAGLAPVQGGLHFRLGGMVSPPALCQALIDAAGERIERLFHREALRLVREGQGWRVFGADDRCLADATVVVLANGYRATELEQVAGLPLQRVRGQLSYLPASESTQALRLPVCYDGYVLPAIDGSHVAGATYDTDSFEPTPRASDHAQVCAHLSAALPEFPEYPAAHLKGRVACRTTSRDHLPLVGALPDQGFYRQRYADLRHGKPARCFPMAGYHSGLYITSGHGSRGLVSCLPSAELLAAQICGEPWPLPSDLAQRLHPARFLVRQLRKGAG